MVRKCFLLFCVFLFSWRANAQLNNSWIDYNKTYYKFRIAKDSLCRITQPVLASLGLASVNADHFQLWRNGQQVRLYTSVSGAALGSSDYIEFWGEMNDGGPDRQLYLNPEHQLNSKFSLETDTATYFLTVNSAGSNLRFRSGVNGSPGSLTPQPFCIRNIDVYRNNFLNSGYAAVVGQYIYSSAYDAGEGYTSANIAARSRDSLRENFTGLNVSLASSGFFKLRAYVSGNAPNQRDLRISVGGRKVYDAPLGQFAIRKIELDSLPLQYLLGSNNTYVSLRIANTTAADSANDRFVVARVGLTYPARFAFNNQKQFEFELPPSATGNYLLIDSFNFGSEPPVLFDLSEGVRYTGDITAVPGKVRFVLPPYLTGNRRCRLLNQENSSLSRPSQLTAKNFRKLNLSSEQGDYLIISNPLLYNDGNGANLVEEYRQYRSSVAGGGFNAKVYDIDELTDQFAFGIKNHPGAVRDFIRYSVKAFSVKPKFVLLLGRAVNYREARTWESSVPNTRLNLVPTFGNPASDILLVSEPGTLVPLVPVGRIGAISPSEIRAYLEKVKEYERTPSLISPLVQDRKWLKNVIHVIGGRDSSESSYFQQLMSDYTRTIKDTFFGAHLETFTKTGSSVIQQASGQRIEDLFREGISFIGYFGHSSANTFEFNLSSPSNYDNKGKYPFFNVSGCSAGNYYSFDSLRLSGIMTISEKYVLSENRGSIGFLADTHFGLPVFLDSYNRSLYRAVARELYGKTIGEQINKVHLEQGGNDPTLYYFQRIHLEQINLHGDPAIKLFHFEKPDFAVEDQLVKISPNVISVADSSFRLDVGMVNLGKAISGNMRLMVKRTLPNDSVQIIYNASIQAIQAEDSFGIRIPVNPRTDFGLNKITVELDPLDSIPELYETNNSVTKSFYIFRDDIRPLYPYPYSLMNRKNFRFYASTANPSADQQQYVLEIDTTELFNSPLKKTEIKVSKGGVIEFNPAGVSYIDNVVYYWRVATIPEGNQDYVWNGTSFTYLTGSPAGFDQSHYYQFKKSGFENIGLTGARTFDFNSENRNLIIRTGLYPYFTYDRINVNMNFSQLEYYGCDYNRIQFYVFDSASLLPLVNYNINPSEGRFGSKPLCLNFNDTYDTTRYFFEFDYSDSISRNNAVNFIDSIPNGYFVAITNFGSITRPWLAKNTFIDKWKRDTLIWGSNKSLYHKLKSIGFTQIDSFYKNLPFLYFYKKGFPSYSPTQVIGPGDTSYIERSFNLKLTNTSGAITSPLFGPAAQWGSFHWRSTTADPDPTRDKVYMQLIGVKSDGDQDTLRYIRTSTDTTLNFVDARQYPYLKLRMFNEDPVYKTPVQLKYLRLRADLLPDGAVAPNVFFSMKDTVEQGEMLSFKIAFKNISQSAFDTTMKFSFYITDRNNRRREIDVPRGKKLLSGDTLLFSYELDTRDLAGNNVLYVEMNPGADQPEQFSFNNFFFREFYVKPDTYNPLLEVTFDGRPILNRDIVSSRPAILIRLSDENKFLALSDTALLKVQIRFPGESEPRTFRFGGDTLRFIPADLSSGNNTASIEFEPWFQQDGEYELIVSGKDAVSNKAGELSYRVTFNVINKPMISNLLNYPNPFSTSTAFVFTVTGSEVPQNLRIQILTITGKVVREISAAELGPIRIGDNITEFKWDGTDMYGQKLANGVYLYRVLTNLRGRKMDKYSGLNNNGDVITEGLSETDKYFNKGYGKMYLMR